MRQKNKRFIYKVDLKWTEAKKGLVSCIGKPNIEVATPPEFAGHSGIWTPEDLFVSSVNACFMTTFLYYAEKRKLKFYHFESYAQGILEKVDDTFAFSTIEITPRVLIAYSDDINMTGRMMELSEKGCLISRSLKSKICVKASIEVANTPKGTGREGD